MIYFLLNLLSVLLEGFVFQRIFSIYFFPIFYFHLHRILIISYFFPSTCLGLFQSFFWLLRIGTLIIDLISFVFCNVSSYFYKFLPSSIVKLYSTYFEMLCFNFHWVLCLFITFHTSTLYLYIIKKNVLFNFQCLEILFSFCHKILVWSHYIPKTYYVISIFINLLRFILWYKILFLLANVLFVL